ncbi:O-antigen ligase family protein [Streptomyces sp. bgisy100]|uniref:O-antigen ligase family protein n=1 Tax=Streptomyces sp. bgisy100 TaxID=3413783 RepID=UPI003D74C46D
MAPSVAEPAARERGSTADVTGVVVLGCCAAWALITAAGRESRPEGMLLALLAVAAGYACGRIGGALLPVAAPVGAALAGVALAAGTPYDLPGPAVGPAPGHTGATAAQLALAAGAACCAAWATRRPGLRLSLRLMALAVAGSALVLGSVAGCVAALVVLICSLAAGAARHRLPALAGAAVLVACAAGGSWALAEGRLPDGLVTRAEARLTEHRMLLWRDAVGLAEDHPVLGAGPDRFGDLSTTVQQTANSDGKPHSAVLKQAAEQGVPGVLLLGAAYGWVLHSLWRSERSTGVALTAGAALTVLALLSVASNALSFVQVTAAAGLLAGLAAARPLGEAGGAAAPATGSWPRVQGAFPP